MRMLSGDDIARRADDWTPLVDAAEEGLVALASGGYDAPVRSSITLEGGTLLTMPGRLADAPTALVKLVSVVPANAVVGRPAIQGVAVVFDARSGAPMALLDGAALTAVRTAAVSAAAVRRLATPDARVLALLGSGAQASWQARAIAAVRPVEQILVWSPRSSSRERLAAELARLDGAGGLVRVQAVDDPTEATREAAIVCCATTAPRAFLHAAMLPAPPSPVLVVAIGAFRPDMAEVVPSVFARAGRVYVDDRAAVLHEGGDVLAALAAGALTPEQVVPVGSIMDGGHSGHERDDMPGAEGGTVVFKSVGSAAEDVAVAAALMLAHDNRLLSNVESGRDVLRRARARVVKSDANSERT